MSRGALLTGTAGGIIGTITAIMGMAFIGVTNNYILEISNYIEDLVIFTFSGYDILYFPSYPYFGQWFSLLSVVLPILLIVTGVLIGVGFYGTYKIGGGAMGIVGLIFGIVGCAFGALFIILANVLATTEYAFVAFAITLLPLFPVATPNFLYVWIALLILGVTFILLGSASITVREITVRPTACAAAGILSIIAAVLFIIGGLIFPGLGIFSFLLLFIAFIIWAVVFYSSREA